MWLKHSTNKLPRTEYAQHFNCNSNLSIPAQKKNSEFSVSALGFNSPFLILLNKYAVREIVPKKLMFKGIDSKPNEIQLN